jgi:reactive intermediate/imine deaminase
MKKIIYTPHAPAAVGTYSQAVRVEDVVYVSGQLGLIVTTGELAKGFEAQCHAMFKNLRSICEAAEATLNDVVKMSVLLTDLDYFAQLNDIMAHYIAEPYPARAVVQVAALPKGGMVAADIIVYKPL